MRPLKMKLKWKKTSHEDENYDKPQISFNKPFKCQCYCFCRPEMTGINHETDKEIGKVIDDWRCCDPSFQIYNENNEKKYKVVGTCCQIGLMCKACPCYETKFFIYNKDDEEVPEKAVGSIVKKERDCIKSMVTDADQFDIFFPQGATVYDKLMIMGTALMIDYTYFEDERGNTNNASYY